SGLHKLWLNVGGSAGHGGLWSVDIEEVIADEGFAGRKWSVSVNTAAETRAAAKEEKEHARTKEKEAKDKADDAAVLNAIDRLTAEGDASFTRVRAAAVLGGERFSRALDRLESARLVERCSIKVKVGNGADRPAAGLRRRKEKVDANLF